MLALAVGILILAAVPVVLLAPADSFPAWLTNLSEYYGFRLAAHPPDGMTASEWLHVCPERVKKRPQIAA